MKPNLIILCYFYYIFLLFLRKTPTYVIAIFTIYDYICIKTIVTNQYINQIKRNSFKKIGLLPRNSIIFRRLCNLCLAKSYLILQNRRRCHVFFFEIGILYSWITTIMFRVYTLFFCFFIQKIYTRRK